MSMRTRLQRLALLPALLASSLLTVAAPAQAAGPTKAAGGQIDGPAYFDAPSGGVCGPPPKPYEAFTSYDPLVMQGDLEGCWYTLVEESRETPSGVYVELGQEVFVGTLNGGKPGTFATTYRFQAKFADGAELFGRCQHPIVAGSGTGGFAGATGRLDFKDIIEDPITYVYRGHIRLR
jgi:hypothetical protein